MYIYARHLYERKIIRFETNSEEYRINKKIVYDFQPFVIFAKRKYLEDKYEISNRIIVNGSSVQLQKDNIYLYGVQFEPNGKIYHYWTNNVYIIGQKIKIGQEEKIVTIVTNPSLDKYATSLVNKFFPNETPISYLNKYVVRNYNTDRFHPIYTAESFAVNTWIYNQRTNQIYYIDRYCGKDCYDEIEETNLSPIKPFVCQFVNKDGSYSNKKYIYFSDSIPKEGHYYMTQYRQLLICQETFCDSSPDDLYFYVEANKNNVDLRYLYKSLEAIGQENTTSSLNSTSNSFDKYTFKNERIVYGLNTSTKSTCKNYTTLNEQEYNDIINNNLRKEDNTMNFMKNLEFGKINTSALKMSMCGLAFQRADKTYATYNIEDNSFTDVTDFLMDMDCIFVMPVAAKDIKVGDIIKHLNTYIVVKAINEDGSISAVSPIKAEEICVIPTKNLFGFNYYSKVMNFFDGAMKPTDDNPFGNPMMLMMLFGDKMDFNGDMKSMLPLFLLNNQNGDMKDLMSNPLFFLAMSK